MDKIYSIIKFGKVKDNGALSAMAGHNFRLARKEARAADIDITRSASNQVLINKFNVKAIPDLAKGINEHYAKLGIKERTNSVKALDFILTTSPQFWGEWQNDINKPQFKNKLNNWVNTQLEFMQKKFGKDNIAAAVLHLDETTPHIHILVLPIEEKETKYKNRYGEGIKKGYSLNSKRYNPLYFKDLVTEYNKVNEKYGLSRGKEGSGKNSISLKEYKKQLVRLLQEHDEQNRKQIAQLTQHEDKTNKAIEALRNANMEIRRMKEEALKREFEIKKLLAKYEPHKLKGDDLTMLGL